MSFLKKNDRILVSNTKLKEKYQRIIKYNIIQNIKETSEKGKQEVIKIVKRFDEFTKDLDNKNFYASVKSLYLQDQQQKKKKILFHR